MRIILTCDPEIPVPPVLYGGIERIVDGLARGYNELGHEVFLVAHSESTCQHVRKIYGWPARHSRGTINVLKNALFLNRLVRKIKPDIIHSFSRLMYLYPSFYLNNIRFVQSYQREISSKSTRLASLIGGSKLCFTSCAAHMLKNLPNKNRFKPVFNFTDTDYYFFDKNQYREYLVFLGRIEDIKGTSEAIEAAISTNHKLIIAGNIQEGHEKYYQKEIAPKLSHQSIVYIGTVNDEQKRTLLQGAKALLFPIKWEEPFGIVMAEALSCGTPVIGFNRGSVPEVVVHGENGFIVMDTSQMIKAISQVEGLNNKKIAEDAQVRFSIKQITNEYLNLLEE
jgi:glycosyltransferase involved in cell wall biosynthesis